MESLGKISLAFFKRSLVVLILDVDERPGVDEIFRDSWKVPEAGIMEGSVSVLVYKIDVRFMLQQLGGEEQNQKSFKIYC